MKKNKDQNFLFENIFSRFLFLFSIINACMHVCVFMALITTLVLCARSQDLEMSVSMRRGQVVLSTTGFKGGGKPCRKTRDGRRAAERHPEGFAHLAGFEPKSMVH